MKTKLILILTFFLCSFGPDRGEKIITIIDFRHQSHWPAANVAGHKDKDFELYKIDPIYKEDIDTINIKAAYMPISYRLKDGKLEIWQDHIFEGGIDYEKASYYWLNDSTVKFRLYNSTNELSESFTYTKFSNNGSRLGVDK